MRMVICSQIQDMEKCDLKEILDYGFKYLKDWEYLKYVNRWNIIFDQETKMICAIDITKKNCLKDLTSGRLINL